MTLKSTLAVMAALLPLSACVTATPEGQTEVLSDAVIDLAGPDQDLRNVRLQDDGCYWWLYEGVVETTYIPLETADGRFICVR